MTLVELMIVVAIIGILAAVAIPNFMDMQYRAKRAEVPTNVDGIKTAELGYDAIMDSLVECADHPGHTPNKKQVSWGAGNADFREIGWKPNGKVRGTYSVSTGLSSLDFTVTGLCDVDGDSVQAKFTATAFINAKMVTAADVY